MPHVHVATPIRDRYPAARLRRPLCSYNARGQAFVRYAIALVAACAVTVAPRPHAAGRPDVPAPHAAQTAPANRSLVETYCVGCHNARTKTAGLDLASLDIENAPAAIRENAEVWEKVVRKLRTGAMPPAGMPRPDETAYDALASSLERALDAVPSRHAGAPALRRLNRTEYASAVRDLLGLEVDAATLLPPDDISGGFDNNAGALGVSRRCSSGICRRRQDRRSGRG